MYATIAFTESGILKRGNREFPHQAQVIRRDLDGEKIRDHFGKTAMGYCKTDEQVALDKAGKTPNLPYRFLIYSPQSCAFNWTAFFTIEDLQNFTAAYDLKLTPEIPQPGERFDVTLPASDKNWLTAGAQ